MLSKCGMARCRVDEPVREEQVDVKIYAHKIRELSESDFVLAAEVDREYFAGLE